MGFNCRQCGTCCMYLGDYIVIERQTGEYTFDCECVSTGTAFTAEVDNDKRRIFSDHTFPDSHPTACRFLRPDGELMRCTIHRDSPAQCKFYRCVIMKLLDTRGNILGTVRGTLDLHSDDPDLRAAWDDMRKKRPESDDEAEAWIARYFRELGYRVE